MLPNSYNDTVAAKLTTAINTITATISIATATTTRAVTVGTTKAASMSPYKLIAATLTPKDSKNSNTNFTNFKNAIVDGNAIPELTPTLYELLMQSLTHIEATTASTAATAATAAPAISISTVTANTTARGIGIGTGIHTETHQTRIIAATTAATMALETTANISTTQTINNLLTNAIGFIQLNSSNMEALGNGMTTQISTTQPPSVDSYLIGMAWPKVFCVSLFLLLILLTVVGNTLVILAVLTTRRLRTVTNCFVMNLAITDWLVGTCVMPPAVILYVVGTWRYGWILCDIWISLDILLCTSSILSLCAISLDRYLAVTQPLTYSKKRRSKRLALMMIFIVWVTALSITCPPYLGWYEPGRRQGGVVVCRYNQNKGYVIFSAMGSFFIPLAVMLYVYLKIGYVLTSRRQRIVRDANSERTADHEIDFDNFLSESEHFQCATPKFPSFKMRWTSGSKNNSLKCSKCNKNYITETAMPHQASFYELVEVSRLSSLIHCSAVSCKYGGPCIHTTPVGVAVSEKRAASLPMQKFQYLENTASYSETCLTSLPMAQVAKINQVQGQQNSQQQHGHMHTHQHNTSHHRIPMRVSTTKRDTKTAKTLTMVMGGFIACWLPFFVYYLLIPFLPPAAVLQGITTFLTWVGWVNSAINPFIYAFYNPDFRTAFWRLTCRRICKKPPPNHMAMFRG